MQSFGLIEAVLASSRDENIRYKDTNVLLEAIQHSLDILIALSRGSLQLLLDGASHFLSLLLETQTCLLDTLQL